MKPEVVLKKAIRKAVENGWKPNTPFYSSDEAYRNSFTIIFSHDFAKAFFGEYESPSDQRIPARCKHCKGLVKIANPSGFCNHVYYPNHCNICRAKTEDWEHHLKIMVLEKDFIKYLEKYL